MIQAQEAERFCIGCVLLRDDAYERAELHAEEFLDYRCRAAWEAFGRMRAKGIPPSDIGLLEVELRKMGRKAPISFLSDCLQAVPTSDNVEFYARIVREAALTRRVRAGLSEVSRLEGDELVAAVYRVLAEAQRGVGDRGLPIGEAVKEAFRTLQRYEEGGTWGIPTGLADFDDQLGGLHPGVLTILAGRPSMGKSSLARTLADGANRAGAGVHVFTPEDDHISYALRVLADYSRMSLHNLRALKLTKGDLPRLQDAANELYQREGWIVDDSTGLSSADIAMRVRKRKRENNTSVVVVDYIQLLREPGVKRGDRKATVEVAIEGLLDLARRENVAVLVLSQLSRECERREDKRPILSDLRETGELEQAANTVLAVYRDDYYNPNTENKGIAELLVLKNKNGRTGRLRFAWDAPSATFRPLSWRSES